jgi:hypothetical protein
MTLKLVICTQDMVSDFIAKLTYLYGNLAVKHQVGHIESAHVDDITYKFFSPSGPRARIQGTCPDEIIIHESCEISPELMQELEMRIAPRRGRIIYAKW